MSATPHMYAGAALLVIAVGCTWSGIWTGADYHEITNTEYTVNMDTNTLELLTAKTLSSSIGEEPQRMQQNPFTEAREVFDEVDALDLGFPRPPAPPLSLPQPSILPLPGDQ